MRRKQYDSIEHALQKWGGRTIALALCACMIGMTFPTTVYAEETEKVENVSDDSTNEEENGTGGTTACAFVVTGGTEGTDYSYADGVLTIKTATPLTIANKDPETATSDCIFIAAGVDAKITLAGVNITSNSRAPIQIEDNSTGNVTITLANNSKNSLNNSGSENAALQKNGVYSESLGKLLIRCEQSDEGYDTTGGHQCNDTCGVLTATNEWVPNAAAGIGGSYHQSAANIYITGGNIKAAGEAGAGIGSGNYANSGYGNASHIYISGGVIDASSSGGGAGIGGGDITPASDIYISGGRVLASAKHGAAIGAGRGCSATQIYISGGIIQAKTTGKGAGIGSGSDVSNKKSVSDIHISGGVIDASSASSPEGAGIGSGVDGGTADITIEGGSVKATVSAPAKDASGNETYMLKVEKPADKDIIVDGKTYPEHSTDDQNAYVWLTEGRHTVNGVEANYAVGKGKLKYAPQKDDFICTIPKDFTYNKTSQAATATLKNGLPYSGSMFVKYYVDGENGTEAAPVDAGTYTVKACMVETEDHIAVECEVGTFTIAQATPDVTTVPTVADREYDPTLALTDSDLVGGSATGVNGETLAGTWSFAGTNIIPAVNNKGYQAVFTPAEAKNYNKVTRTITVKVTKVTPVIAEKPAASTLTYGQTLADSTLTGGKAAYKTAEGTEIAGTFAWKNSAARPTVADSGKTEYDVIFIPEDIVDVNVIDTKMILTVNKASVTPDMPGNTMAPAHSTKKVGDIALSGDWSWSDTDKDTVLADGVPVTATAVYTGADKGNYETESVTVTITRSTCEHRHTEIRNHREATCKEKGYTGDTYCKDCNKLLETGKELTALGHDYKATVTKQPTTTEEGIMTYTCSGCNSSYTESIAKLPEEKHNHSYTGSVTREATCTEAGVRAYTCSCGDSYTESISATGHSYVSKVTKTATTTEEGIMTYTCSKCGHSYTQPIARLKANDGNKNNGNRPGTGNGNGTGQSNTEQKKTDTEAKTYSKDDSGKEGWGVVKTQLEETKPGETVTVAVNETTVVPKDVLDSIKGEDVTLVLTMENGISWKINGQDVTEASGDIDFGVTIGADAGKNIPVDVINNVTGERTSVNLTLAYDGEFGFTATLIVNMKPENTGLYANLFYYNEQTGELEFVGAGRIDADGNAELTFTHASDYTIVIDKAVMDSGNGETVTTTESTGTAGDGTVPTSNADETKDSAWNPTVIIIVGICILLIGFGAVIFARKKSGSEEE